MTIITREQHQARLKRCAQGKHKIRENKYGVSWCVNCGLLSNKPAEPLKEEDKLLIR